MTVLRQKNARIHIWDSVKLAVLLRLFIWLCVGGIQFTLVAVTLLAEICLGSALSVNSSLRFLNISCRHPFETALQVDSHGSGDLGCVLGVLAS